MTKENKEVLDRYRFIRSENTYTLYKDNYKLEIEYSNVETFEDNMSNYDVVFNNVDRFEFRLLREDLLVYKDTMIYPWGTIESEIQSLLEIIKNNTNKW